MQEKNSLEEKPNIPEISSENNQPQKTKLSHKYVFYFRVSEEILKNHRALEADSQLMPFKEIIRLIDEL